MKEWSSEYNSFNSYKGLLYRDHYDGIINKKLMPPVEVNIDPCNDCQLFCVWCNGKNIIDRKNKPKMSKDHLFELIDFCGDWGVKAVCFAGGGEPTLHENLAEAIERTNSKGMESAIITNGLFRNNEQLESVAKHTRWAGISVDAGDAETYKQLKKVDCFDKVCDNIRELCLKKPREVTFKFLIHPDNQSELYKACVMAKRLGCNAFHTRLISTKYLGENGYNYELIDYYLGGCRELESDNFKVYSINHKQQGDGNRRIRFDKCQASPLLCMLEANGDVSVCIDRKGDKMTRLCSHNEVSNLKTMWGSTEHFELLDSIQPHIDCPKCTLNIYNEQIEAYKADKFCMNFP